MNTSLTKKNKKKNKTDLKTEKKQMSKKTKKKKKNERLERGRVKSQEEKKKCSLKELVNLGGSNFCSEWWGTFVLHIQQSFPCLFSLYFQERSFVRPRWKISRPTQKFSFLPP